MHRWWEYVTRFHTEGDRMDIKIDKASKLFGDINVPGDKSISHRALMLLSLCYGEAYINNFLHSSDCMRTLRAMEMLGAKIDIIDRRIKIEGLGKKLKNPPCCIYLGNSGTSIRLLSGILAGLHGTTVVYGDSSLNKRPMNRIIEPLKEMGAHIESIGGKGNPPIYINGGSLRGIDYKMSVASAQVKSCIMLASIFAEGETVIYEKMKSRDHTERMLEYLGYDIKIDNNQIEMRCGEKLQSLDIDVPGDISSAAFLIAAGVLVPGSCLIIRNVGLNDTRTGFLDVIKKMGANLEILNQWKSNNETFGDLKIKSGEIKAVQLSGDIIPRLIDEIPIIALLAAFAEGDTYIKDIGELKYKESNRIEAILYNLREMGVAAEETNDCLIIRGGRILNKNTRVFNSFNDHRIAMVFSIAGLILGNTRVTNYENIITSFPNFINLINSIGGEISTF